MAHEHQIYDTDKRFVIDSETRVVAMSSSSKPVLVQYDHDSEHITFEVNRYIEGHDLSKCDKVEIHYNNIASGGRYSSKGVYQAEDLRVDTAADGKVMFTWVVSERATQYAGPLCFIVSFVCTDDGDLVYRWNSLINNDISVSCGINNGEAVVEHYADVLEMWKLDLFGIGDTEEAQMLLTGQQQKDALTLHAQKVLESMPSEYMDYSAFEKSKANVSDINRLFDSDFILGKYTNYYPHGDHSFEYDGVSTYTGVAAHGSFYLETGIYNLVVTDTNAIGVYVSLNDGSGIRLLGVTKNIIGVHSFEVPEEHAGKPLVVMYYAAISTPNEAGMYYLKRPYIFRKVDKGLFDNEFFFASKPKMFDLDIVKQQVGENLYTGGDLEFEYDGVKTYAFEDSVSFTLDEGDYILNILESNAINHILYVQYGDEQIRLVASREAPIGYKFTISSEYAGLPMKIFINASFATPNVAGTYYAKSIYIFKDMNVPFLPEYFTKGIIDTSIANKLNRAAYKAENGYLTASSDTLLPSETLVIDAACDVKNNKSLVFTGKFSNFSGLRLGHGKTDYGGTYIELYPNKIDVYQYQSGASLTTTQTHNMTLSRFVTVVINVGVSKANIAIITAGNSYTLDDVAWSGCNGKIFVESINTEFVDCDLRWTTSGVKERVWVFGDSYLGFNDNRWAGQMHKLGFKNWMACGFPGGASARALEVLKTMLTLGTPETIVWCLGMNNGDSGAVNSSWLSCIEEVLAICKEKRIVPILATIPTCPKVDNTYKNDWVRASGYRYVDFSKAVGVNGTSWYSGMLSADEIHPTELGAKALASRVCIDVPEIMQ